ncbi:MAG: FliH/SctL family protein [Thalassospira sp.]|uniref:FliH/SctL family protein n=1 Tax=Thalassospira sp. TaxID=1912094 RepID=UPI0032EBF9BA
MTAIEKFTFSLSFDDADNVIRSSGGDDEHYAFGKKKKKKKDDTPPPPPPVYTEEQAAQMIAEAEQKGHAQGLTEGHAQGFEQGHQEVMASVEKAIGDVESVIAEKLDQIDEQQKRANAKINEDAIHVALGVMRKLAPAWSKQYELTEIEDIVRQCLANLFDAPKVLIKVHPDLEQELAAVSERIALSRGFSGKVIVVGEPDVAIGDCMVSWGDGTAVRDTARVWSEINEIIDNALSLHAEDHDLSQSNMGDLNLQETRLSGPQHDEAPVDGADAQPTEPISGPKNPTSESSEQSHTVSPQFAMTEPETSTPSADVGPAQNQVDNGSKEGDGTDARNVQTSSNDAMPQADHTPETPQDQEKAAAPDTQQAPEPSHAATTDDADEVIRADTPAGQPAPTPEESGAPEQKNVTAPEPQPAPRAPESQRGQSESAEKEMPVNPTEAEDLAAVKQPTKDAGDENG